MSRGRKKIARFPKHLREAAKRVPIVGQKDRVIIIAMGMYATPNPRTISCLIGLQAHWATLGNGIALSLRMPVASDLVGMRNATLQEAMMLKDVHVEGVLYMDDDITFNVGLGILADGGTGVGFDPLDRLWARDKDVIGALCTSRSFPLKLNIAKEDPSKPEHATLYGIDAAHPNNAEPFQVDNMGFGMVLVRRRAILKLIDYYGQPVKVFNNELRWQDVPEAREKMEAAVSMGDTDHVMETAQWLLDRAERVGEDWSFCRRARRAGVEIWCDPSFEVLHHGDYGYGRLDFMAQQQELARRAKEMAAKQEEAKADGQSG